MRFLAKCIVSTVMGVPPNGAGLSREALREAA